MAAGAGMRYPSVMKTYVVGDLQGCHGETVALVEKILETEHAAGREPPAILFCGELINRAADIAVGGPGLVAWHVLETARLTKKKA